MPGKPRVRRKKQAKPPTPKTADLSQFNDLISEFKQALTEDTGLATKMIVNANNLIAKRQLWANRIAYRETAGLPKGHIWANKAPHLWSFNDAVEMMESAQPRPHPSTLHMLYAEDVLRWYREDPNASIFSDVGTMKSH